MEGKIKEIKYAQDANFSTFAKDVAAKSKTTDNCIVEVQYQTNNNGHYALIIIREK